MDEEKKIPETDEAEKSAPRRNRVVLVQTLVCAFLIFLAAVTGKVSPETFELLKKEYDEIMSVDMTAEEVVSSAMGAVRNAVSVKASAAEPQEKDDEEKTEEKEDGAIAVMAELGSIDEITVPVHGAVSSEYGYRTNPVSGEYALHTGVDIAADEGTDIVAAYNGVVKETGDGDKCGKYVLMLHSDGSETFYCHCSEILVGEGDVIMAGEPVALVGETGWATGPHLHFEIYRDGNTVDPLEVLSAENGTV